MAISTLKLRIDSRLTDMRCLYFEADLKLNMRLFMIFFEVKLELLVKVIKL